MRKVAQNISMKAHEVQIKLDKKILFENLHHIYEVKTRIEFFNVQHGKKCLL